MTNFKDHRALQDRPEAGSASSETSLTETDVIVVGTGAAGHAAAVAAARGGASVVMLEAAEKIGGTTYRSSGGYWIPNNRSQRERGTSMEREETLKHMASLSFPERFDPEAERLGLPEHEYSLIAAYYDNATRIVDELDDAGILGSTQMDYPNRPDGMPPYYETPYDATAGTVLGPRVDEFSAEQASNPSADTMRKLGGRQGDGADLIGQLSASAQRLGVEIRVEHRVDDLLTGDDGEVVGVAAATPQGAVTLTARKGVVFATGGFSHNPELADRYLRGPIVGSCSVPTAQGDFIGLALDVGAEIGNLGEAWWTELPVELVKTIGDAPELISFINGASSMLVNAEGRRVVNEKLMYNERGKVHFVRDADGGFPNRLLFLVYDEAVAQDPVAWPARWPIPPAGVEVDYVITGQTLEELQANIAQRLSELVDDVGDFALKPGFATGLAASIERFNGFAQAGADEDFGRGNMSNQHYDPPPRPGLRNGSLAPLSAEGPYYAMILGAATLDTKCGPKIDAKGRVLRAGGDPIAGLYGAGNCIASPAGAAYWGGGSTLGPAIVYGTLAGDAVAREPARRIVGGALA